MNAFALSPHPRRGAAMIIAITMIGLVAVALVMVGQLTTLDARRSADERTTAQLRMMLLAGQDWLLGIVDAAKPGENVVPLPPTLVDGTLVCDVGQVDAEDHLRVVVRASMFERMEIQTLTFARKDNRWALLKAELAPMRRL